MKGLIFCIARGIELKKLDDYFKHSRVAYHRYIDYLVLNEVGSSRYVYYFVNGTVVMWNVRKCDAKHYLEMALPFLQQGLTEVFRDSFVYREGLEKTNIKPHEYFNVDVLTLRELSEDLFTALSYGFSRSIKLKYFEALVLEQIERYNPFFTQLAQTGRIKKRRSDILKIIGNILQIKSLINLKADYSVLPSFFWEFSNLEEEVLLLERYLNIPKRVITLNQKIDILNDNFLILNNYLEVQHSHFLEWLIIGMIGIEIFLSIVK